ncbi:MAG: hypothetical protein NTZ24_11320 [Deltaproteobacteria bacterium]|nr:hypothetical protein [Deltaproteobacteria bacterium]
MYNEHPCKDLKRAFSLKPFQGAEPEYSKFLFVGLDANYDICIQNNPIFMELLNYLDNGVEFWKKQGVHHPFLLPTYQGDGQYYHKTFSAIGFGPKNAADVSFIELLNVPTYGKSALVVKDLVDKDKPEKLKHLQRVNAAILNGSARYVFIPGSVAKLMRASGQSPWLPNTPTSNVRHLKVWKQMNTKTIYWHYHLSVYGKFYQEKLNQLDEIKALI